MPRPSRVYFSTWLGGESFAKSFALAFRADGDLGFSFAFPRLIVKNVRDPLARTSSVWSLDPIGHVMGFGAGSW